MTRSKTAGKKATPKKETPARPAPAKLVQKKATPAEEAVPKEAAPKRTISEVYNLLSKRIESLENRLSQIEKRLPLRTNGDLQLPQLENEISEEAFLKIVWEAYHRIDDKLGDMVTIPALTSKIKEKLGWDLQTIHDKLYELYLNHKIDLQPGKIKEGAPMKIEGNVFYWFKFR